MTEIHSTDVLPREATGRTGRGGSPRSLARCVAEQLPTVPRPLPRPTVLCSPPADAARPAQQTPWQSVAVSVAIHVSLVAALALIPTAVHRRFSTTGQSQVIAIEATLGNPTPLTAVAVTVPTEPLTSMMDSPEDRWAEAEPIEPTPVKEPIELLVSDRVDLPRASTPPPNPTENVHPEWMFKRRPMTEQPPKVKPVEETPRPKRTRPVKPPSVTVSPMKQFAGAEERTAADLSQNAPPPYPLAAVRDQLQGTVLLRLTIDKRGRVTEVQVAESSGHVVLDQAAVDAVSRWRGTPAKRWGVAVETVERLPIRFRL